MALQILNAGPDPEQVAAEIKSVIIEALPDAVVEVEPRGPGHFEIKVVSNAFAGESRVRQQQIVYGAITHLMAGSSPPVHAVDRMECVIPE